MVNRSAALVILSGGQDSTTCLFWAKERYQEVYAITFDYGQRHKREIEAAAKVSELAGVIKHETITLGPILKGSSPLVSDAILEQYDDMFNLPGGLEKTFVPGRNLLFLTVAANYAYNKGVLDIITGVCEEDFGGYPDCRQSFITATEKAIQQGFGYDNNDPFSEMTIKTPLMNLTKAQSVLLAIALEGCYEALAYTHTAYDGAYPPTGQDHATLLRAKGFLEAGIPDPLVLRACAEGLMPLPDTPNYEKTHKNWTDEQLSLDFGDLS